MKIKELREEKKVSQQTVADAIGTSCRNIGRWENSENEPTSSFLIALANYFECSIDYLVGRSDDFGIIETNADLSTSESELLVLFRSLPEVRQETLLDTMRAMSAKEKNKRA